MSTEIESHGRERKVVVFKFKRRKGHQKKNTHRQEYTMIKVGKLGSSSKIKSKNTDSKAAPKKAAPKKAAPKKAAPKKAAAKKASADKKIDSKE